MSEAVRMRFIKPLPRNVRAMEFGCSLRIKICGITNTADALAAAEAGADAIGLNLMAGPRRIEPSQAAEIIDCLPPFMVPIALVRLEQDRLADPLAAWLKEHLVSHVQLYGDVTADALKSLRSEGFRPIVVIAVKDRTFAREVGTLCGEPSSATAVLLDAHHPDQAGGTGRTFPWAWVTWARTQGLLAQVPPLILAGGLRPENVAEAVQAVRPWAVDVSSGVEVEGTPGRKDPNRMLAFIQRARAAAAEPPPAASREQAR